MNKEAVLEQLVKLLPLQTRQLVSTFSLEEIGAMSLFELGLSSMQGLKFIMEVEDTFSVKFEDTDLLLGNALDVERIIDLVKG